MMSFLPLALCGLLFCSIANLGLLVSQRLKAQAVLDADLSDQGEDLSRRLSRVLDLNRALEKLHALCLAQPELVPELSLSAQALGRHQEVLLRFFQVTLLKLRGRYRVHYLGARRDPPHLDPCKTPGSLHFSRPALELTASEGGLRIEEEGDRFLWHFHHPEVLPL